MSLSLYKKKRNFSSTKEPQGNISTSKKLRFVVQRHHASRLHYDFRLELGGVLKSWAVPKGPSLNPRTKRLAVMVEDHPVDYITFQGKIPEGNYGAGMVEIWDNGSFAAIDKNKKPLSEQQALLAIKKGELKFILQGKKLKGEFVLVRLKDDKKNWLLIKHKDEYAVNTIWDAEVQGQQVKKATSAPAKRPASGKKNIASIRYGKGKKLEHFIKPMLASATKIPFDDAEWIFEIKWDGYRAIAEIKKTEINFYSRNGLDFSERFPAIYNALKKIKHNCILDGEIVLLNEKNFPDFQKLQYYENHQNFPLLFYVFDMLSLKGKNIEELALTDRKQLVKKLLGKNQTIRYCDHVEENGIAFFEKAKEQGLEGIMAKRSDSLYARGYRSKEWLKIKNVQNTEAIIAGYIEPKGERKHFGSLILATKKGRGWQYRGHVGTGFSEEMLASLKKQMASLETEHSPFTEKIPANGKVTWLKPTMVADIAYTEITRDHIFRHPVFLRLRDDKDAKEANDESGEIIEKMSEVKKNTDIKAGRYNVPVTNLHKIFWPDEGITKGDVIRYYEAVSSYILPHLKNRPLSLKRNPNGIQDEGFYHKDAGEDAPAFADVFKWNSESSKKVIDYLVCNNKATLLYLANLGCIEMNPWNSMIKKPNHPTWMVIDIDPSPKNSFTEVIDTALATQMVLQKAGIKGYCKTSGASGLHVYVPMKNKYDYETVKGFAHIIASLVQEQLPKTTTLERSLAKRGNNIYIDYLQNRTGQTLASVYSLRPVPGATVSTPLEWKEVNHQLHFSQFTLQNIMGRLQKKGDLFLPVLKENTSIETALKKLNQ